MWRWVDGVWQTVWPPPLGLSREMCPVGEGELVSTSSKRPPQGLERPGRTTRTFSLPFVPTVGHLQKALLSIRALYSHDRRPAFPRFLGEGAVLMAGRAGRRDLRCVHSMRYDRCLEWSKLGTVPYTGVVHLVHSVHLRFRQQETVLHHSRRIALLI